MNIKTGFLIGFFLSLTSTSYAFVTNYDSLGVTKKAGHTFIIHQVEEGETLYSLSRRYNVDVDMIEQENPEAESGLKIGQKLLVPLIAKSEKKIDGDIHIVKESETLYSIARSYNVSTQQIKKWNDLSDNNIRVGQELVIKSDIATAQKQPEELVDYSGKTTHTVATSETLYSLGRQYNVSIEQLREWNKLEGNELSIGQVLIVGTSSGKATASSSSMLPNNMEEKQVEEAVTATTETTVDVSAIKTPEVAIGPTPDEPKSVDNKKVMENGFARVIEGSSETKKYLALHRSAPVGTIMQVKNTMNNQTVFVRVVGALPNTGENNKILLKISKKAFDRLGAVDSKFPVEISYVP